MRRAVARHGPLPRFLIAKLWTSEYGDPDIAEEFAWLHAYSPYHHVVDGTCYPATLVQTAEGDSRVDPLHARKMVALLQAASPCLDERPDPAVPGGSGRARRRQAGVQARRRDRRRLDVPRPRHVGSRASRGDRWSDTGPYDRRQCRPQLTPVQQRTLDLLGRTGDAGRVRPGSRRRAARRLPMTASPSSPAGSPTSARRWCAARRRHQARSRRGVHVRGEVGGARRLRLVGGQGQGPGRPQGDPAVIHWRGEIVPITVVDEAIERLADDDVASGRGWQRCRPATPPTCAAGRSSTSPSSSSAFRRSIRGGVRSPRRPPQYPLSGPIVLRARIDLTLGVPRRRGEPQGDRRPQDRAAAPSPPRGPALLRPDRDARARRAAPTCSPPTRSTRRRPRPRRSPSTCCARRCAGPSMASSG